MAYHVFIERAQDAGNVAAVAASIAARYGLPEAAIVQRMAAGRFRVKANVELETAKTFARDLERLGAVCTIVDASAGHAATATPQPSPVGSPPTAAGRPPAIPSGPARPRAPQAAAKAATIASPTPAAASAPAAGGSAAYESGLSAALAGSGDRPSQELGAIETGNFMLASLDGEEDQSPASDFQAEFTPPPTDDAFAPPDSEEEELVLALDAGRAAAPAPPAAPAPAPAGDGALPSMSDAMFAPPDAEQEVPLLVATPPPRRTPAPMPAAAPPESMATGEHSFDGLPPLEGTGQSVATRTDPRTWLRENLVERPRVHFAAGILLAILLAWIPARIYWGAQVDTAQATLSAEMQEPLAMAQTSGEAWDDLDEIGRAQLALADSRLVNTKITAVLIWLLFGTLLGYLYYRRVPWDAI